MSCVRPLVLALLVLAPPAAAQKYVVSELPPLTSFGARVWDLNDAGVAVGHGLSPTLQQHALRWPGTGVNDLTPTNALAEAQGLSESGVLAGCMQIAGTTQAVRWNGGTLTPLGWLPGHIGSFAQDVNDAGLIAGWSVTTVGDPVACIWNGGAPQAIGATFSWAFAASETGDVVGRQWVGVDVQAFRWRAGVSTVLPDLGPNNAQAVGISPQGRIAGAAQSPVTNHLHGVVWDQDLNVADLGDFLDFFNAYATDVNDAGVAVGGALTLEGDPLTALVWRGNGTEDLQTLIQPGSGWTLKQAQAVNRRGEIVGMGLHAPGGGDKAFILRPDCDGDGIADLAEIAAGSAHDSNGDGQDDDCQHCQANLGFGGPGAMQLSVCGDLLTDPSGVATFALEQAPVGVPVLLIAGPVNQPTPLKGGMLVPVPPIFVSSGFLASPGGTIVFPLAGSAGAETSVYVQAAAQVGGAAQFSNAVELVIGV